MTEPLDLLESRIDQLRRAIRDASKADDPAQVAELRDQLRRTQAAWDALVDSPEPDAPMQLRDAASGQASMLPAREHVHRVLTLLGVPAAPKVIVSVHEAFFPGDLSAAKLSSLRRDEERSYRSSPGARPYYLCPALAHDLLSPVRALITVSTWTLEQRVVGPLSQRVDYLTSAVRIAEAMQSAADSSESSPAEAAVRLLWRFAVNIPEALAPALGTGDSAPDPQRVAAAARAELELHAADDRSTRASAARRARKQLTDAQQLFGAPLRAHGASGTA